MLEKVIKNRLGLGLPLKLDDDAHTLPIGLITEVGDAVDFLVLNKVGDTFNKGRFVSLIR